MSKTIKIINKVPHSVLLMNEDGTVNKMFPKSNGMIRIKENTRKVKMLEGVPITKTIQYGIENLPKEIIDGTYYIVSSMVQAALPKRPDLLVPKGIVRDNDGNIVGCTSLDLGYAS